jgi:hypothetical protein
MMHNIFDAMKNLGEGTANDNDLRKLTLFVEKYF